VASEKATGQNLFQFCRKFFLTQELVQTINGEVRDVKSQRLLVLMIEFSWGC